jgi:hypothetical protein
MRALSGSAPPAKPPAHYDALAGVFRQCHDHIAAKEMLKGQFRWNPISFLPSLTSPPSSAQGNLIDAEQLLDRVIQLATVKLGGLSQSI